jgi:hypothetical protein
MGFQTSATQRVICLSQCAAKVDHPFLSEAVHVPQIHRDTRPGHSCLPGLGSGGIAGPAARPPGKPDKQQSAWPLNRAQRFSLKRHARALKLSHWAATFDGIEALHEVSTMIWKFLSLQKMLDALFDDSWFSLGLPEDYVVSYTPAMQVTR